MTISIVSGIFLILALSYYCYDNWIDTRIKKEGDLEFQYYLEKSWALFIFDGLKRNLMDCVPNGVLMKNQLYRLQEDMFDMYDRLYRIKSYKDFEELKAIIGVLYSQSERLKRMINSGLIIEDPLCYSNSSGKKQVLKRAIDHDNSKKKRKERAFIHPR